MTSCPADDKLMFFQQIEKRDSATLLGQKLTALSDTPPAEWKKTGPNSRPSVHGLLRYPAMMVPCMQGQILDHLLEYASYAPSDCYVLDPFVGSGTILTESTIRGLDFVGVDINPLAVLVCEVKKLIDQGFSLEESAKEVISHYTLDRSTDINVDFPRLDKWFSYESAIVLSRLRRSILKISNQQTRKVLWVIFAETIRQCSNSRTSTYKLHIRKLENYVSADQIVSIFKNHLNETLARIAEYSSTKRNNHSASNVEIILGDIRQVNLRQDSRHQILVTSPPYGDNHTTIPYGQFSYLSLRWIPFEELPSGFQKSLLKNSHALDAESLGGNLKDVDNKQEKLMTISPIFAAYIKIVEQQDKLRNVRKVSAFMHDFYESLVHIRSSAKTAQWVMTTGNRTVAGIHVPFDKILLDIVEHIGGQHIASVHRALPGKRMPARNSLGTTINTEVTLIAEFI